MPAGRDLAMFMLGVAAGFFLWTAVGRRLVVKAVSKGAGVAESKVREWVERGQRKLWEIAE